MKIYLKYSLLAALFLIVSCGKDTAIDSEEVDNTPSLEDNLPRFKISTNGNTIVDEPKVNAQLAILVADELVQETNIGIEFRGSSSQLFPKKSFGFETRDASNEDLDIALFNYPEEEDWILYAPYSDKALIRNKLIYDLSRDIGRYASRSEFVELEVNDEYRGVYVFMEKLKRDNNRINLNNLKDDENSGEDLTGGYILKIDKLSASDFENGSGGYNDQNSFTSGFAPVNASGAQEINFLYEDPDADDITMEQRNYISNYVTAFETALASDNFTDETLGYQAYIEVDSFIDFFILTELANNVDGYRISTYLQKDKNEKLSMGPIWDFNLAFGNANYCEGGATNVWAFQFNERCATDDWLVPFWWNRLLQDPQFVQKLQERWEQLRSSSLSNMAILGKISNYEETLIKAGAIDRNFQKWDVLGRYVWPNNFIGETHSAEIEYLENWVTDRIAWLDMAIPNL